MSIKINIQIPEKYQTERQYIFSVIFDEFLGLDFNVKISDRANTKISLQEKVDRSLIITDKLFNIPEENWLKPDSLPTQPLKIWDINKTKLNPVIVSPHIPVIYGDNPNNSDFFQQSNEGIYLGLDIFGSAFFMLTRYEEIIKPDRDKHDRFPATASLAYQENFLDRPIINEYLEILWSCLKQLYPQLQRKNRHFKMYISHDVDEPFKYAFMNIYTLAKQSIGDILKRHKIAQSMNNILQWQRVKIGYLEEDPSNTFNKLMDISEEYDLKSSFYFIADRTDKKIDGNYKIDHPWIRQLIKNIYQRGHEIGLHTSYKTYQDSAQTSKEFGILRKICQKEGIKQKIWGGRQHFLRWKTPTTFQNWADAGLDYDTSLCFADVAGFRCGICYEFSTFNVTSRQHLKLIERPLIVMECTLIDERYMNLGLKDNTALKAIIKYKQFCRLFNGNFTLLWHNNRLINELELKLYKQVVSLK